MAKMLTTIANWQIATLKDGAKLVCKNGMARFIVSSPNHEFEKVISHFAGISTSLNGEIQVLEYTGNNPIVC